MNGLYGVKLILQILLPYFAFLSLRVNCSSYANAVDTILIFNHRVLNPPFPAPPFSTLQLH